MQLQCFLRRPKVFSYFKSHLYFFKPSWTLQKRQTILFFVIVNFEYPTRDSQHRIHNFKMTFALVCFIGFHSIDSVNSKIPLKKRLNWNYSVSSDLTSGSFLTLFSSLKLQRNLKKKCRMFFRKKQPWCFYCEFLKLQLKKNCFTRNFCNNTF